MEPIQTAYLARDHPRQLERYFISWLHNGREEKGKVLVYGRNTCVNVVSHVKTTLDYCNLKQINWDRIRKNLPKPGQKEGKRDRKVLLSEARMIFDGASKRERFLITLFYSGGMRLGAFWYSVFNPEGWVKCWPKVSDLEIITLDGVTFGKFVIYRGDPEEYFTFVSPECIDAWTAYKHEREASGETITSESPLIVNEKGFSRGKYRPLSDSAIEQMFIEMWDKVGLNASVRKFHCIHGFRKSFKTNLENAGMKTLFVKILQNHGRRGLNGVYYRDDEDQPIDESQLAKEYAKCIPALCITEIPELKLKIEAEKKIRNDEALGYLLQSKRAEDRAARAEEKIDIMSEIAEKREELKENPSSERILELSKDLKILTERLKELRGKPISFRPK